MIILTHIPAEHNITEIDDGLIEGILSYSDEELAHKNLEDSLNLIEGGSSLGKEEKGKLETFLRDLYKEAMPYEGWRKYDEISLKYNGQIVCKKKKTNE